MSGVSLDYRKAEAAAQQMRTAARTCGDTATLLRNRAGGVGQYWQGKTAEALASGLTGWSRTTAEIAEELSRIAADIQSEAEAFRALEAQRQAQMAVSAVNRAMGFLTGRG